MAGPDPVADELDAVPDRVDLCLVVQVEQQLLAEKVPDRVQICDQTVAVVAEDNVVVHVPDVEVLAELVLDELIELVEADVREHLAGQVPDRHTAIEKPLPGLHLVRAEAGRQAEGGVLAVDDRLHEPERALVVDLRPEDPHEDLVADAVEVLRDIQLQEVPRARPAVDHVDPLLQLVRSLHAAFSDAAAVAMLIKLPVDQRVQLPVDRPLYDAVLEAQRHDQTLLGLVDEELPVPADLIGPPDELVLDLDQVLLEVCREGRDLAAVPFPRRC